MRALVPHENAEAGLDLGEKKQALAVTGADGQVLAGTHRQTAEHLEAVRCHRCRRHYA
ncbi:MAG: hypothetical protein WBQ71_06715 [Trebonia sp.]